MTDVTTVILSKLAALLELDTDAILTQSVQGVVNDTIAQTQKKISRLYLEHQRFQHKYDMSLKAFLQTLDALEENAEEDTTIHGVPWLEAVTDSRWWPMSKTTWRRRRRNANNSRPYKPDWLPVGKDEEG